MFLRIGGFGISPQVPPLTFSLHIDGSVAEKGMDAQRPMRKSSFKSTVAVPTGFGIGVAGVLHIGIWVALQMTLLNR